MKTQDVIQILSSPAAVLVYELIGISILLSLIIYMLKKRKKTKKKAVSLKVSVEKDMLDKALTNEKRQLKGGGMESLG